MKVPYIGVTGIEHTSHTRAIQPFGAKALPLGRKIMAGILVCDLTIDGKPSLWPQYPEIENVKNLFPEGEGFLNLIHYNSTRPERVAEDLEFLSQLCGDLLHGFQINKPIPDARIIADHKARYPHQRIVLQVNKVHLKDLSKIAEVFQPYANVVDDFLIDPSSGLGVPLEPDMADETISELEKLGPSVNIAGGFEAGVFGKFEPLFKKRPNLSFDAQGRLCGRNKVLDIFKMTAYLEDSIRFLNWMEQSHPNI